MSEAPVFAPARKVIPSIDMRMVLDAGAYLSDARRIHSETKQAVAKAQAEGSEQGYREGFDRGRTEALAQLVDAIGQVRQRLVASDEELAEIVFAAVEQMLGEMDRKDAALRCVRRALDDAASDVWAILRVSPDDLADVERGLRSLPLTNAWPEIRGVESDPLLKPGEIILETPKGRVHVGLRQQLSRLKAGLQSLES